jgi:pSer/pThr/pTyr-binding forkhead associated (FHA) protein
MFKRLLVIDRDDLGQFVLSIHGGTLKIGASGADTDIVLRDLHLTRLHCEIELDEDLILAENPEIGGAPIELRPGATHQAGLTHLRFLEDELLTAEVFTGGTPGTGPSEFAREESGSGVAPVPSTPEATRRRFRFRVVDGADRGRHFGLPETGVVTVGKSHKDADIILNDLYVSRVHCEVRVEADRLLVRHVEGQSGTLINGKQIEEQELYLGMVLRVGNTHLLLESFEDAEANSGQTTGSGAGGVDTVVETEDESAAFEVAGVKTTANASETDDEPAKSTKGGSALPHSPADQLLELEGQTFGQFKIDKLLGRGQSGVVFRALNQKTRQIVGLKVIAADFPASDGELSRFVAAVKMASSVHHPGLVTVFGAGKSGAHCWLSREYVDGESVSRRIRRLQEGGKPDWKSACRVALQMASILDYLHRNQVSHGNITPRNVLIRSEDQTTKLADLMLNPALEGSQLQHAILDKKLVAELPYMAPEQTDPHAAVTPLGDIYSLGAVLYALLTGKPPFCGETKQAILAEIHSGKVTPISKLQRGIPALLETSVLMMMARHPEERFQNATDLREALQSFADKHAR